MKLEQILYKNDNNVIINIDLAVNPL